MAFVLKDRVRESTTTAGTGAIALGGAPGGYQSFGAVMAVGDTCWYAMVLPGSAWETGVGTYSAPNTLTRTTILESSDSGATVSFAVGTKDVLLCMPASKALAFPSGTLMLFQQTSAPLYWTKQTTHNDKALRVVSGTAGFGGATPFSTVSAGFVTSNTTIGTTASASHSHTYSIGGADGTQKVSGSGSTPFMSNSTTTTSSFGLDGAHNHIVASNIQYVDLIIAKKD